MKVRTAHATPTVTLGDLVAEIAGLRAELHIAHAELKLRAEYERGLKERLHMEGMRVDSLCVHCSRLHEELALARMQRCNGR